MAGWKSGMGRSGRKMKGWGILGQEVKGGFRYQGPQSRPFIYLSVRTAHCLATRIVNQSQFISFRLEVYATMTSIFRQTANSELWDNSAKVSHSSTFITHPGICINYSDQTDNKLESSLPGLSNSFVKCYCTFMFTIVPYGNQHTHYRDETKWG